MTMLTYQQYNATKYIVYILIFDATDANSSMFCIWIMIKYYYLHLTNAKFILTDCQDIVHNIFC